VHSSPSWDYFIAYATADRPVATRVFELLTPSRVFLDHLCLQPGTAWPAQIAAAHDQSRCTVLVVTESIEDSWYAQSEYVRGIDMVRKGGHVMVPLLYGPGARLPYGTEQLQAVTARTWEELPAAVGEILHIGRSERSVPRPSTRPAEEAGSARVQVQNNSGVVIAGGTVNGPVVGAGGTAQVNNSHVSDEEAQR
jgi:hypothetical protein